MTRAEENGTAVIAVIVGGPSFEAAVSRDSGAAVATALARRGHKVDVVEASVENLGRLANPEDRPDLAWLATHGPLGEDGTLQGFCEMLRLPYTGSGPLASALCMDKTVSRSLLRVHGIDVNTGVEVDLASVDNFAPPETWTWPMIVKPASGGSSIATARVSDRDELREAAYAALEIADRVLVEPFLEGRELSVGVLDGRVLGDIEVIPPEGMYTFEAKYADGSATEYVVNPDLEPELRADLHRQALTACRELRCEGQARVDFILVEGEGSYFLEVNTIPGMTSHSLLPQIAASAGMSFDDLVETIAWGARLKC